jgi:hypothetical protein
MELSKEEKIGAYRRMAKFCQDIINSVDELTIVELYKERLLDFERRIDRLEIEIENDRASSSNTSE